MMKAAEDNGVSVPVPEMAPTLATAASPVSSEPMPASPPPSRPIPADAAEESPKEEEELVERLAEGGQQEKAKFSFTLSEVSSVADDVTNAVDNTPTGEGDGGHGHGGGGDEEGDKNTPNDDVNNNTNAGNNGDGGLEDGEIEDGDIYVSSESCKADEATGQTANASAAVTSPATAAVITSPAAATAAAAASSSAKCTSLAASNSVDVAKLVLNVLAKKSVTCRRKRHRQIFECCRHLLTCDKEDDCESGDDLEQTLADSVHRSAKRHKRRQRQLDKSGGDKEDRSRPEPEPKPEPKPEQKAKSKTKPKPKPIPLHFAGRRGELLADPRDSSEAYNKVRSQDYSHSHKHLKQLKYPLGPADKRSMKQKKT